MEPTDGIMNTASKKPPLGLTPRKLVEEAWKQEADDRNHNLRLSQLHKRRQDVLDALERWAVSPNREFHNLLPSWIQEFLSLHYDLENCILLPHPNEQGRDVGWTWWMPRDEAVKRVMESLNSDMEKLKPADYEREIELLRNEVKQLRLDRDEYGSQGEERLEDLKVARRTIDRLQRSEASLSRQVSELQERLEAAEARADGMEHESGNPSELRPVKARKLSQEPDNTSSLPPLPKGWVRLANGHDCRTADQYWVEGEGWKWFDNEKVNEGFYKSRHFCRRLPA